MNCKDKERIMIVDDDVNVGRSLALIFGKKGYKTETAHTGQEALDIAKGKIFNIALLDINLPDMEGIELIAPLKEMHPDMALIMVTGYASMENAVRALNEGVAAYNTKPLNIDEVLATVENVVDKQHLISEKRHAEEALRKSEERLTSFMDSATDIFVLFDLDLNLIEVNKAALETWGVNKEDVVGKNLIEISPNLKETGRYEKYQEVINTGNPFFNDDTVPHHKFGNKHLAVKAFKVGDGLGIIITDITERKRAEEAHIQLSNELMQKNKELEQIVYATSHDLRSPLVNVQGFSKELEASLNNLASIIKDEKVPIEIKEKVMSIMDDDIAESLEYILSSVFKMDSLLNGLLRLSRLDRTEFKKEKQDMNKIMTDIVKNHEFQIKRADVNLHVSKLPPCKGDETQINQVFSNLIDNAIKYLDPTRPGNIMISGDKKKGQVVYSVEDNGIGIDQKNLDKIFDIFHQLNPEISSGEGLGLTIIRKILDKHDGKVWVESVVDNGSKFFISLPTD